MGSHSVTHPAEVTFPPLPQPIKAGIRFSDPEGCKAELIEVPRSTFGICHVVITGSDLCQKMGAVVLESSPNDVQGQSPGMD